MNQIGCKCQEQAQDPICRAPVEHYAKSQYELLSFSRLYEIIKQIGFRRYKILRKIFIYELFIEIKKIKYLLKYKVLIIIINQKITLKNLFILTW